MKKILITGKNGYVGKTFSDWVRKENVNYLIDTIDLRNSEWKRKDFSIYDCVIHLAAIVHKKHLEEDSYYYVNRDLTEEVAFKSKESGVKQFIFFSTMSVYGKETGRINSDTPICPKSAYGKSKLEAEKKIEKLKDDNFIITILRPPMIYGRNSPGNYKKLSEIAKYLVVFPKVSNKRSMIYIDNLHSFLRLSIDYELSGIYCPQNSELVNTSNLVKQISIVNNRKIFLVPGFNFIINIFGKKIKLISKIFGSLYYDDTVPGYPHSRKNNIVFDYQEQNFNNSIKNSES